MVVFATASIIVASAFFVAVEFSLMAVRRNRLEAAAVSSRAARAALRSSTELTVLLAGAQLGITVCTLALGAITKPAVHHALTPLLAGLGLPEGTASVIAFVLALLVVTFLHLVVGEMAPKSWAIAHPEFAAISLALPMRGFLRLTRPMLVAMNRAANVLVRKLGVEPVDELSAGADPAALRALVEHSVNVGALDPGFATSIHHALELREQRLADLVSQDRPVTAVPATSTLADVQAATIRSGHLRVLVLDGDRVVGVVHVRDTLAVDDLTTPASALVRTPLELPSQTPLYRAVGLMREASAQIVVVRQGFQIAGVVTIDDILPRLLPVGPRLFSKQSHK